MTDPHAGAETLVETVRGEFVESVHRGHAVVMDAGGRIVASWGDPAALIYPRSSCKMIQALPLIESGAAAAHHLTSEHLALACASHNGAEIHRARVARWLSDLGLSDAGLRCGPQTPADPDERETLRAANECPCQMHNNCSGKHSGFLKLNRHLGGSAEYIEIDHPVQRATKDAFEEMTGETSPGFGIDGCSAPNHVSTVAGLARAMARMARPEGLGARRSAAATELVQAMHTHPDLIAGEERACTVMMRAMAGGAAIKTGAEGVFVGILPQKGWGIALKIADGTTRAAECAIAALLVRAGVAKADDPAISRFLFKEDRNRRGVLAGYIKPTSELYRGGALL